MSGADLVQPIQHDSMRDLRPIALATEMAEVKMTQIRRHNFGCGISGGLIREMSMTAKNPLLKTPGPMRTFLQQPDIVIRLEEQDVCRPNAFNDKFCSVAEVRQKANIACNGP